MHEIICEFPNITLYESKLVSDSSVAKHVLKDLKNANNQIDDDEVLNTPVVFFDTSGLEFFEKEGDVGFALEEGVAKDENPGGSEPHSGGECTGKERGHIMLDVRNDFGVEFEGKKFGS